MFLPRISAIVTMITATCCFGLAIDNCGTLYVAYTFINDNSVDGIIELVPNEAVKPYLVQNDQLRWFQYALAPQSSGKQIQLDSSKYEQKDLVLIIRRLISSDVGKYTVDCKINGHLYRGENDVKLEIPPLTTHKTGYVTTSSTDTVSLSTTAPGAGGMTDTVIIVVALCAVVIVVVVAGTLLLVQRKQATTKMRAARLVSYDGGSTVDLHKENDTDSVYNEIDIDNDYTKVDKHAFNSSKLTLLTLAYSPSLPRRPSHASLANNVDNDYDLIRDERAYSKNIGSDVETLEDTDSKFGYAKVIPKSQRTHTSDATDITSQFPEYSKVLKRSEQCKTDASFSQHTDSPFPEYSKVLKRSEQSKAEVSVTNNTDSQFLEYSKVVKRSEQCKTDATVSQNTDSQCPGYSKIFIMSEHRKNDAKVSKGQYTEYSNVLKRYVGDSEILNNVSKVHDEQNAVYNVTFPAIDCSEIKKSLGADDKDLNMTDKTNDEPVKYCNLVSRSRRSQARASRASRNELHYAILDHAVSVTAYETLPFSREDELKNIAQCQYAAIDFDMEAFVAPVRKAPSSWYKRANKDKRRK